MRDEIPRPPAQLMLAVTANEGAQVRLARGLTAAPIASVIISPPSGEALSAAAVRPLIACGQEAGAAMLIESDGELARTLRADGVHLPVTDKASAAFEAARAWLGGRAIIGADAGRSRDDAMALGELGADYVAFGIPEFVKRREEAQERQIELVGWWAEIFEVPVVAMNVRDVTAVRQLVLAGADFVCITVPGDGEDDAAIDWIASAGAALEESNRAYAAAMARE
ncbi:MAG: thiamine phosphate synthase [Hyphomicrobiaceae bacterium]